MAGVLCALLCGFWLGEEQTQLADRVIRFHVIANSDTPEDQALKLQVRDAVLSATEEFYPQEATLEEARAALSDHLGELARTGQETVEAAGYDYPVTASLEKCWFPTKEYDGFALGRHAPDVLFDLHHSAGSSASKRRSMRRRVSSLPMNDVTSYMPGPLPAPTSAKRSVFITCPMA